MVHLLFRAFYGADLSMGTDGGLLIASSRERLLAWGIVFCVLAATALCLWLFRVQRRLCVVVLLGALLIPLLVMPSIHAEQIYVQPRRITVDSGVWLLPSHSIIDLTGLREIHESNSGFHVAGYLVESNSVWTLDRHGRDMERLMLNSFFTAHRMAVAQYLRDRGHIIHQ